MKRVVNAADMKQADTNTMNTGISQCVLMERAALSMEKHIVLYFNQHKDLEKTVLIAVGNGNNGGDGVALGRLLLQDDFQVTIWLCGSKEHFSDGLKQQIEIAKHYQMKIVNNRPDKEYSVVVDALFGVGLSRNLDNKWKIIIEDLNQRKGYKISVDLPSGISADTGIVMGAAFKADFTVTFAFQKIGLMLYPGKEYVGRQLIENIGIMESSLSDFKNTAFTTDDWKELRSCRAPNSHKGTFGKVLVIAGAKDTPGAAILSAKAALRSGVGMLKLISARFNRDLIVQALPEVMFSSLEDNLEKDKILDENLKWCDVVCMGPGLSNDVQAIQIMAAVVAKNHKPMVLDADALNMMSTELQLQKELIRNARLGDSIIVTPHLAELSRITGKSITEIQCNRMKILEEYVKITGFILVSKDAVSIVAYSSEQRDSIECYINSNGNSGMATAGSGDVLSGMIAAQIAQKDETAEISKKVIRAVFLHGLAGDYAASRTNESAVIATDLIDALLTVLK